MGDGADQIRYGFVGVGMMGQEHVRNVLALPGAAPVAAADPHEPSRSAAATIVEQAGAAPMATYADTSEMLQRESLDALVVSTPNHTHRDVLEPLWGSGLHLLVEKPLCTTVADCLHVRGAAAEHDAVVWVGLEYRYMPPVQRFLTLATDPATVGRLRMLSIREHRFPFLVKVGDWNRFNVNTGGTLVEKCCHFFDLMRQTLPGRPVRVFASGAQDVNHLDERYEQGAPDVLDNAFVVVDFDDGARALLDLSMFAEGSAYEQELTAVGDGGKVEVRLPGFMEAARGRRAQLVVGSRADDWPVEVSGLDDDERVRFQGAHHGASYLEHLDFCEAIRTGARPSVTVDDGLWSVAMGAAAHRSIDEGRPVTLDEVGLTADLVGQLS
jgi:predicted dehydrogenase